MANASVSFRVSVSVFSVKFRVRPWLILNLLPMLILNSVANSSAFLSNLLFKIGRMGKGFCFSL